MSKICKLLGYITLEEYQKMDSAEFIGTMFSISFIVCGGAYFSIMFYIRGAGIVSILPLIGFIHLSLQRVRL